jgi:hypothetical protein
MVRWERGADRVEELIARGELQRVSGGEDVVVALLDMSGRHIEAAKKSVDVDQAGAYALAYDAARKASTAVLAHQGLRPTSRGGHIAVVEAVEAQFPGVPGLKSLDRLRRRRNQAEYPDPAGYDPITLDETNEAIAVAVSAVDSSRRLIEQPEIGMFR